MSGHKIDYPQWKGLRAGQMDVQVYVDRILSGDLNYDGAELLVSLRQEQRFPRDLLAQIEAEVQRQRDAGVNIERPGANPPEPEGAQRQREEDERRQREEDAQRQREEDARRQREEDERRRREEDERRRREEDARRQREEDARRQREEDARRQREEDARRQREEDERRQREEDERRQREEDARRQREEDERRQREQDERRALEGGTTIEENMNDNCMRIAGLKTWFEFQQAIMGSSFSDEDWVRCGSMTRDQIRHVRSLIETERGLSWSVNDQVELRKGSEMADVYFIGATSSGKSCVLSSIANRMRSTGDLLIPDVINSPGMAYWNYLTRCHHASCLPDATARDVALYVPIDVLHDVSASASEKHQWNFVEMAGERLAMLQQSGDVQDINPNGWLDTGNVKVINFVIDPTYDPSVRGSTQDMLLNRAFMALRELGVFEKVALVNIVVNKFDTLEVPEQEWNLQAKNQVSREFSALVNSLKQHQAGKKWFGLSKKKLFEIHVLPFSIGNDFSYTRFIHSWDERPTNEFIKVLKETTPYR